MINLSKNVWLISSFFDTTNTYMFFFVCDIAAASAANLALLINQ